MTWSSTEINCTSSASMVSPWKLRKRSNFKGTSILKSVPIVQGPAGIGWIHLASSSLA